VEVVNVNLVEMFMLGLLGTGHCIGMCGPIIFALPGRTGRLLPHVWYHVGRITTYTAIGGILGALGQLLAGAASPGGGVGVIKAGLWLLASVLLALFGATRLGLLREPAWLLALAPERMPGFKRALASATAQGGHGLFFILGAMLGFLPCGLSYGAFAQALGTGSAGLGTLLTLAFAAGTAPGLILLGTGASAVFRRYRRQSDLLSGLLMFWMAFKMGSKALRLLF
jgi:sulfite exporter TauE/SafE